MWSSAPSTGTPHELRRPGPRSVVETVTPPPLDFPAPVAEDLLGEDWFGEGSVFDTGEDLARALMVLADSRTGRTAAGPAGLAISPGVAPEAEGAVAGPGPIRPSPAPVAGPEPADEFQIATMPSARGPETSGWGLRAAPLTRRRWSGGTPGSDRRGWSIRQSVQLLRMTEEIMARLREEAAQLTWQLAAAVHRETDA